MLRFCFVLCLLCWCTLLQAGPYIEIPKLSDRVTDLTGTLTPDEKKALENKLADFEAKKGSQIAVLIVPTTQPSEIEEFGIEVADLWSLGRKGIDDGLIFIISKDDRKQRFEVGRGLSGVIPDAVAKRIIAEIITPYFQKGDFAGGINAGIDKIISLVDSEPLPAPKQKPTQNNENGFIFLLFGGLFAGSLLSSTFGRVAGGLIAGVGSGLIAYWVLGFGIGAILIGLIVFFLISSRFSGGGGGWSNGGGGYYGGGGRWGGGGSSSSWSGGGGTFDGGGASGSW
ncbi:MAG: TPM domain-containing protein [Methylococcaceae bacterium]|nr:TPM domain-containing protein [Methylococcaceae bacterium]